MERRGSRRVVPAILPVFLVLAVTVAMIGVADIGSSARAANASTFITGGTDTWTLVNQPSIIPLGSFMGAQAVYRDNSNATVIGIVIMTLHNGVGQTVYYTATSLTLAPGGNATAYEVVSGLPSGNYNATFFATTPNGVAISLPTTTVVTLP